MAKQHVNSIHMKTNNVFHKKDKKKSIAFFFFLINFFNPFLIPFLDWMNKIKRTQPVGLNQRPITLFFLFKSENYQESYNSN